MTSGEVFIVHSKFWAAMIAAAMLAGATVWPSASGHAQGTETQGSPALDALPFRKKLQLAKAGDEDAQMAVALAYDIGSGTRKSPLQAAHWYRLAAQRGNARAQFRLARILHTGARNLEKNMPLAAQLYEAAANQGHHEAEYWTGYCYEQGEGVAPDLKKAVEWYTKAADGGAAAANNSLGLIYLSGKNMARDLNRAFRFFKAAADQGDPWAENNLGGMYEMGWGVAADQAEAVRLYQQAAAGGNPHGLANLKRLGEAAGNEAPARDPQN